MGYGHLSWRGTVAREVSGQAQVVRPGEPGELWDGPEVRETTQRPWHEECTGILLCVFEAKLIKNTLNMYLNGLNCN